MVGDEKAVRSKPEVLANGALIAYDPLVQKWAVLDGYGVEHGYRYTVERARAFALTLPGSPHVPPQAPMLSRSQRVSFPQEPCRLPTGVPREERHSFDFNAPSRGAPTSSRRDPMAESRALTQAPGACA